MLQLTDYQKLLLRDAISHEIASLEKMLDIVDSPVLKDSIGSDIRLYGAVLAEL